jgi:S-adenosylmethionine uptake transporter
MPAAGDLLVMASTGVIAAVGSWCLSSAYRVAAANLVAPFEYTAITWAVMWGFLLWGEVPGPLVATGVVMIVAAGLHVLRAGRAGG